MDKTAKAGHPIHPLIAARWSPRSFADKDVPREAVASLFESARWAASSFNEQPWRFIVAERSDREAFERMAGCLVEGNRAWARRAALLIITVVRTSFARNDKPNRHATHDLGLAVGNMSLQATDLGLSMHQMAGFDANKAREVYGIPEGFDPVTAIAVGYRGEPDALPDNLREMETSARQRTPLTSLVFGGRWESPAGY